MSAPCHLFSLSFAIPVLLLAATGQALPIRSAKVPAAKLGKKRQSLLARSRTEDPGFFRNYGVRGGVDQEDLGALGDDGKKQDSSLGFNMWTSDSMRFEFPFLDNMEPVAPMDSLRHGDGAYGLDAMYVPQYLNPDAFPTVTGSGCKCQTAAAASGRIQCECGNSSNTDHYTWLKDSPVPGTNTYNLKPADITYSAGDYWNPKPGPGGVIPPLETMPRQKYPNQAPGDHIWPVPASAAGDRVGVRYARYLDQVQSRFEECDTVSKKCTVECRPGDSVQVLLGSTQLVAKITKTYVGNAVEIEFVPSAAANNPAAVAVDCPLEASCSAFRFCRSPGKHCVHQSEKQTHNWQGDLVTKFECPPDTHVCATVSQVLMATMLRKEGKACKAAAR